MLKISFFILLAFTVFLFGGFIALYQRSLEKPPETTKLTPHNIPVPTSAFLDTYKLYDLVNDYRENNGLKKLLFDPSMCAYANKRLSEIQNDWSHNGYSKSLPPYFSDLPNSKVGENLAKAMDDNTSTLESWISSPSHLKNIVDPVYTRTCITTDNYYVVQQFASF